MKKRVKTVKEYDEICSEKAEVYVFLPEKDMDCLVEYVQTLEKTLRKKEEANLSQESISTGRFGTSMFHPGCQNPEVCRRAGTEKRTAASDSAKDLFWRQ